MVMGAIAANPNLVWLTVGFVGKAVWFGVKLIVMGAASLGLVVLNVGAERIETLQAEAGFDGSWATAQKLIAGITETGRTLTDEEKARIDAPVKAAFRRFARFGRPRKS